MIELTTTEGEIGVYKNHVPLTYIIAPGILRIMETGETKEAALHSGFIEILQEKILFIDCFLPFDYILLYAIKIKCFLHEDKKSLVL